MKLLHASILHRHGARGPGASELGLWEAGSDCEVLNNWLPTEIEQLCEFGHQMVCNLGKWFAEKYQGQVDSRYMPLWRCSSSGRGKESGVDFIEGFRSEYLTKGEIPSVQRELSPDHYFRPWKIYCSEAKFIKSRINTEPRWVTKAEEHKEFLVKIFSLLKVLPAKIKSLPTLLWSTTYLVAIKDCELFATTADNNKVCLSRLIPDPGDWKLLNELACWVWAERFLFSGFEVHMGGHIAVDLLEDLLRAPSEELNHALSIFSGHDYTLLGLLGLIRGVDDLTSSAGFSSFLIFELWEGDAPFTSVGSVFSVGSQQQSSGHKFVRVKYNANPFFNYATGVTSPVVQETNERVLKDYSLGELEMLLTAVKLQQEKLGMLQLPVHVDTPDSSTSTPIKLKESHSIGVSPLRTNVSLEEQLRLMNELDAFIEAKAKSAKLCKTPSVLDPSLLACCEDNG